MITNCRTESKKPLKVYALSVRQKNGFSKEEQILEKEVQADRLANAAIHGLVGLKPDVMVKRDKLDMLLSQNLRRKGH